MLIIGTFEQKIEIEQALAVLENKYVSRKQILVIFMDSNPSEQQKGRTRSLRSNSFEVGIAIATGSAVIGASVGFILRLGPIIWGLIATFIGFIVGYSVYYFNQKNRSNLPKRLPEVTVIIECLEVKQVPLIKDVLWEYQALTVGTVEN